MEDKQRTADEYNSYAKKWSEITRGKKNLARDYLEKPAIHGCLPDLTEKRVLTIGCGNGDECALLQSIAKEVVGIDISAALVDEAKQSYPELEFQVMDMESLDFPSASFDFVYSSLAMHYLDSWTTVLQAVSKVLTPGGTFLFSTHHPAKWGAQGTRSAEERTAFLGYKKNLITQEAEIFGDYLNTQKIEDVWFDDFAVTFYNRSFESMFADIFASDFTITNFLEPKAITEAESVDPMFFKIRSKIPIFVIFELQK